MYEFLETKNSECIPFSNYKTTKVYGIGGKWVNAPNRQALGMYREILDIAPEFVEDDDPQNIYFFQKQTISVCNCLRAASREEKLYPKLGVNVLRKVVAVWAKLNKTTDNKGESAEELFAKVARADNHLLFTAEKDYAALTPEEHARLSKHCFFRLMGEPQPFPSFNAWKKKGRTNPKP